MNQLTKQEIENQIHTIRGQQVMLDSDLAVLYGTETKFINRAVNRNPERFPDSFAFDLNEEEWNSLRFQNGTLNVNLGRGKHRKYLPKLFTELSNKLHQIMRMQQHMKSQADSWRLAQWMVKWLIEYSTSYKLLGRIGNFVFRNRPPRKAPKHFV